MNFTIKDLNEMIEEQDGVLDLSNFEITSLPDNLDVPKCLDLSGTKISYLPKNLKATTLDITATRVSTIPDDITIRDNLFCCRAPITKLPDNLTVPGYLDLRYTPIKILPENLNVGETLILQNTDVCELPKNLTANCLNIVGTKISVLPKDINIKCLCATSEQINRFKEKGCLPDNIKIYTRDTSIESQQLGKPLDLINNQEAEL